MLILGVTKVLPVPNTEPPEDTLYQLIVPLETVAPRVTVPASQRDPGVPVILSVEEMDATTGVREEVVQPALVAST